MAARDMTFKIPEDVALLLSQQGNAEGQSRFVAEAVQERIRRKQRLEAACDALNADPAIAQLEKDWDVCAGDGLEEEPNDW